MTLPLLASLDWSSLHLSPVALDLGYWHLFGGVHPQIRWYSLAYIAGILIGWWYLLRLVSQPGAPMARRHADDVVFYATLGIILGGRLAYVLFYRPEILRDSPEILRLWEGGMSFHGGAFGVLVGILFLCWRNRLNALRVADYVSCCAPFGLFFGRIANFVNGELWGRPTSLPWGMIFPGTGDGIPRHPSQLYEAGLEGILLGGLLSWLFWRTDARYQPGRLMGVFVAGYGVCRTLVELVRQPDQGLEHLSWGLTMGQTLSIPMILVGGWLIVTAPKRRIRVEAIAGGESIA